MRVEPKPLVGIVAFLLYVGVVAALTVFVGPDYDEVAASTENILNGVVIPVGAAAVGMVALTSYLGWWGPALRDRHRAPAWTIIAPLLMVGMVVFNLVGTDFGQLETSYLLVLAGGMLLVGLGEELTTRGVLLVSMRGRANEFVAWLVSTVCFGLMHLLNFVFGQDLGGTLQQVALTMIFGTGFYILRRATGSLIWAMLLHALWDFSIFVNGEAGEVPVMNSLLTIVLYVALPLALIWAIKGAKERLDRVPEPATA
ncbi:CPBP family intramembrane glutamic endopeptidase [uncultured Demequina sp.]|uniref:CPBP family intramembrane glutamic endopeptidase n=1 Tax=uncultured Demequina sp. TaxID=693499 RepID=UPI0025CC22D9|nr:CPBP family intramembrane glutamic endopeptidase [uncultured Demequina sp.]